MKPVVGQWTTEWQWSSDGCRNTLEQPGQWRIPPFRWSPLKEQCIDHINIGRKVQCPLLFEYYSDHTILDEYIPISLLSTCGFCEVCKRRKSSLTLSPQEIRLLWILGASKNIMLLMELLIVQKVVVVPANILTVWYYGFLDSPTLLCILLLL